MNTRLVWNFEISSDNLLNLDNLSALKDEIKWEARYFWPGHKIITLYGLDERFLYLTDYVAKHRQDRYSLLPHCNYNIKQRRSQLLYKPLLQESASIRGYGKKINLANYPPNEVLPGAANRSASTLLAQLQKNPQEIDVTKEALIYQFATEPSIKLELARLKIREKIYFSVCIEGRSHELVTLIANHLLNNAISCDYVSFLRQSLAP